MCSVLSYENTVWWCVCRYIEYMSELASGDEKPHTRPVILNSLTMAPVPLFNKMKYVSPAVGIMIIMFDVLCYTVKTDVHGNVCLGRTRITCLAYSSTIINYTTTIWQVVSIGDRLCPLEQAMLWDTLHAYNIVLLLSR